MSRPRSGMIDAGAVRLAVHEWGGVGAPVLLAHPTGFHGRVWAPVAERLVARGRQVWSFDFRGHGDSDAPDIDYSWAGFADDVLAVTDHLGLAGEPALLAAGHSKGGAALLLAETARPGTFRRIWTYEPIVFPAPATASAAGPTEDSAMARAARRRRNEWPSMEAALDAYASKPPLDAMAPESLRAYVEYGLRDRGDGVWELKCRPEVEARVYAMGTDNGAWARLGEITAAVHVAVGARSADIPPQFAVRIVERLPNGTLEVMAGLGHFGPQEDPDAIVDSLLRFADGDAAPPLTPA